MSTPHASLNLPKPLGDGLVLRLASPDDIEAVGTLYEQILRDDDEPVGSIKAWTRDLMSGRHPEVTAADFIVVEDTTNGKIVSATGLMRHVWTYDDVPFSVGRPELVATDPAYRRRGLVRAIFAEIHKLSAAYGHQVQAIVGIEWYYRQFGYEYALPLGGGRPLPISAVPSLKEGETEPYHIRPAIEADLPTLMRLYQNQCRKKLVTTVLDEARWRYDLSGHSPESLPAFHIATILDPAGQIAGYYITPKLLWGSTIGLFEVGVEEGVSLWAVLPSLLRALKQHGDDLGAKAEPNVEQLTGIRCSLGVEHPLYDLLDDKLGPMKRPYAWYVRVPDLPAFIRHIGPVLERRLAHSALSGYSGELKLTFYRSGMRLAFESGKLVEASDWPVPDTDQEWTGAGFPPLVFLQLLFGYRSLEELHHTFPDCRADQEPALLLKTLFPKQTSWVVPPG